MDGCLDGLHPSNQKARGPCIGARCLTRGESATYQTSCRTPSLQNLEDEHKVSWVEEYQCSIFVPTALHGGTHRCTHTGGGDDYRGSAPITEGDAYDGYDGYRGADYG